MSACKKPPRTLEPTPHHPRQLTPFDQSPIYCWHAIYEGQLARPHQGEIRDDGSIVEIVIWELLEPLPLCKHRYKYRLCYGAGGASRVRYDNERGKGDHRHIGDEESDYAFSTVEQPLDDFERDIAHWG